MSVCACVCCIFLKSLFSVRCCFLCHLVTRASSSHFLIASCLRHKQQSKLISRRHGNPPAGDTGWRAPWCHHQSFLGTVLWSKTLPSTHLPFSPALGVHPASGSDDSPSLSLLPPHFLLQMFFLINFLHVPSSWPLLGALLLTHTSWQFSLLLIYHLWTN